MLQKTPVFAFYHLDVDQDPEPEIIRKDGYYSNWLFHSTASMVIGISSTRTKFVGIRSWI